jgi:hypothetical protein
MALERLRDISLKVIWEKQRTSTHHRRVKRLSSIPLYQLEALSPIAPSLRMGPFRSVSVMTSDDRLSLILHRLDEIERKLDRMSD